VAFYGVSAVGIYVNDVVETINSRCRKTECKEGNDACDDIVGIQQSSTKEHGNEYKPILNPLLRTNK